MFVFRFRYFMILLAAVALLSLGAQAAPSTKGRLAAIRSGGEIKVGLQKNFQPFHIDDARKGFPGLDMEIARALARALDVRVRFVFLPLNGLLNAAGNGTIDLALGGVSSNLERSRTVRFARPYLITSAAGLLNRNSLPAESGSVDFPRRQFDGLRDLRFLGKLRIGVRSGTSNHQLLKQDPFFKKHDIVESTTREALLASLKKNSIDLLVADRTYLKALIKRYPALRTPYVFLQETYREEHLSPVVPPGDAEYLLYIDFFIKEMERTGQLDQLEKKYFDSDDWIP